MTSTAPKYLFIIDQGPVYIDLLDYIFTKDFSYRFLNLLTRDEIISNLDLNPEVVVLNSGLEDTSALNILHEIRERLPHIFILVILNTADNPSDWLEAGADDFMLISELTGATLGLQIENHLTRQSQIDYSAANKTNLFGKKAFYLLLGILVGAALIYYL